MAVQLVIKTAGTVVELFFDDGQGNSIVYAQSSSNLSHNVDTENSEITKVFLSSGYEGVLIEKAGTTLLWEQNGYFYLLYASDKGQRLADELSARQDARIRKALAGMPATARATVRDFLYNMVDTPPRVPGGEG